MKLAALPIPDNRTTVKLFTLVMVQTFIPVVVYRFVFQTDLPPSIPAYLFAMMGLGYAAYRVNTMPFWLNMVLTVTITFASVCIGAAGSIYW